METVNPNVMYVDYKMWYNKETGVVTLDEEMNLDIPNGKKFEFKNNQFTPIEDDWDEKRMDIIGQNGNNGEHYNVKWTYNTYNDAYEDTSLMGILYENKED